jgi:hypothetical protein
MAFQRIEQSAPSAGYEPLLVERGVNRVVARGMAHILVRRGNRIARENKRVLEVVRALKFLAKPHRNGPAIARRVNDLLVAWEETSIIETIFNESGLQESEFISLLKLYKDRHGSEYQRLTEIAASLIPQLRTPSGRRVSAASAAHQFFLENLPKQIEQTAYTHNPIEDDFTDALTKATRREFGVNKFDPRPAHRRRRAGLSQG